MTFISRADAASRDRRCEVQIFRGFGTQSEVRPQIIIYGGRGGEDKAILSRKNPKKVTTVTICPH